MTTAFVIVATLALIPQVIFTVLYWKWIPAWVKNPYGRLAQFDSWCRILFYSIMLFLIAFGSKIGHAWASVVFISGFVPVIFFGIFQLALLKRAVDSAKEDKEVKK